MSQIPADFLDTLKTRVNLPRVAEALGLHLKQAGRLFKACCPFHEEKTPSFVISERRGGVWGYKCFGCGQGGDAIELAMHVRGISFIEAVEWVAGQAGLTFTRAEVSPKDAEKREKKKARRAAILEAMELAAAWFEHSLSTPENPAQLEIYRRKFNAEVVKAFRLGFAPQGGGLLQELSRAKVPLDLAVEAGLLGKRDDGSGYYERFRNRLVVPIRDRQGRVVGFSGRYLGDKTDVAKYENTKEVEDVFSKGSILFALDLAWKAIGAKKRVIVVEGHLDAVAMHAHGFPETVALMGTALTEDHVLMLAAMDAEVVLLLDGDKAGREATWKAVPLLTAAQIPSRVALLPEGEDPDSLSRGQGIEAVKKLVEEAKDGFTTLLGAMAIAEPNPIARARHFQDDIIPVLSQVSETALELYTPIIKKLLSISPKMVVDGVKAHREAQAEKARQKPKTEAAPQSRAKADIPHVGDIIEKPDGTHIVKDVKFSDDAPPEVISKLLFTGHIDPKKRIRLGTDGEILMAEVKCPRRKIVHQVTLDQKAWASKRNFKEAMTTMDFGWFGTDDELVKLMVHLSRQDVPIVRGTRVLGYHLIDGKWGLVCSDRTLLPGGEETRELIHYADGETGVVYDSGQIALPERFDFETFRENAWAFSTMSKAASILGWIAAVPFKARLAHALRDKRFPFLCLWGERGAAKSVYMEQLALEFLAGGQVAPSMLNQLKAFPAMLTCSLSNLIPFGIDEHKGDWQAKEQRLILSETVRNTYQGGVGKRGRKDGTTQRIYPASAPLIVAGEDAVTEPAAQERMVEVFLSKKAQAPAFENWKALRRANLPGLGFDFMRWALDVSDEEVERVFRQVHDDRALIREAFRDRIRHNVAVTIFGLRMMAAWLEARGCPWDAKLAASFEKQLEAAQFQARYPSAAGKNKSIVDNIIEFMSSAAANHILKKGVDYTTHTEDQTAPPRRLFLRLSKVYPLVSEWAARTRYQGEIIQEKAFLEQLKQEPYFKASAKAIRFGKGSSEVYKALELDCGMMLEMGIQVDGFVRDVTHEESTMAEWGDDAGFSDGDRA